MNCSIETIIFVIIIILVILAAIYIVSGASRETTKLMLFGSKTGGGRLDNIFSDADKQLSRVSEGAEKTREYVDRSKAITDQTRELITEARNDARAIIGGKYFQQNSKEAAKEAYNEIKYVTDEIGDTAALKSHLKLLLPPDSDKNATDSTFIGDNELLSLLTNLAEIIDAKTAKDIYSSGAIKYQWMLDDDSRRILMKIKELATLEWKTEIKNTLSELIKNEADSLGLSSKLSMSDIDVMVKRLEPVAMMNLKFSSDVMREAKKKSSSLEKVVKNADSFQLDIMGILSFVRCAISAQTEDQPCDNWEEKVSVADKLNAVDLAKMRIKDPWAVKSFIARIKSDINWTEEISSTKIADNLRKELLRDERMRRQMMEKRAILDRRREIEMEKIRLDSEKMRIAREKDNLRKARQGLKPVPPPLPPQKFNIPQFKRKVKTSPI